MNPKFAIWWNGIGWENRLQHSNKYYTTDDVSHLTPDQIQFIYNSEIVVPALKAAKAGILSDDQLKIALNHFEKLTALLAPFGDLYGLVYRDAKENYERLNEMKKLRKEK